MQTIYTQRRIVYVACLCNSRHIRHETFGLPKLCLFTMLYAFIGDDHGDTRRKKIVRTVRVKSNNACICNMCVLGFKRFIFLWLRLLIFVMTSHVCVVCVRMCCLAKFRVYIFLYVFAVLLCRNHHYYRKCSFSFAELFNRPSFESITKTKNEALKLCSTFCWGDWCTNYMFVNL